MKISIFVTSYNQCDYLREAIDSVLTQTLMPSQIIVVDDASSDDSQDLIADYNRHYPELFSPIYHRSNMGVAQARIDALKAVTGDYVTYVDGDDWLLPEKLEREAAALQEHPEARIAFSNNEYWTEDGRSMIYRWINGEIVPQGDVFCATFAREFPRRSLFRMELVHYDSWRKIGFHDPSLGLYEDFDMRIRLTQKLKVVFVDQVLSRIRTHKKGLSSRGLEKHITALDHVFKKNFHLLEPLSKSARRQAISGLAYWIASIATRASRNALCSGRLPMAIQMAATAYHYRALARG
ncbi:MAG: glycosyltransferase [Gammaproteobacteria bacterium]|nr:glycosyltransferase [Gammaproteobacteria bacterium]